jgi:hypothetical protein
MSEGVVRVGAEGRSMGSGGGAMAAMGLKKQGYRAGGMMGFGF